MLTLEVMGLFGLAILWVNTLLVVGAALTPLSELSARARRTLRRGEITSGDADGVLATHVVEQVGRRASDDAARQAILFHDRAYRSEIAGGSVNIDGETIDIASDEPADVWVSPRAQRELAATPSEAFDEAYLASRRAKGFVREVRSVLAEGQPVWFAPATTDAPLWLCAFDPHTWLRNRRLMVMAFQLAMVALSALVTWLCLYPPVFGTVSTVGGLLGLIHFLLIMQPLGVTVRELALLPHQTIVRGSWVKPGTEGTGIADLGHSIV